MNKSFLFKKMPIDLSRLSFDSIDQLVIEYLIFGKWLLRFFRISIEKGTPSTRKRFHLFEKTFLLNEREYLCALLIDPQLEKGNRLDRFLIDWASSIYFWLVRPFHLKKKIIFFNFKNFYHLSNNLNHL